MASACPGHTVDYTSNGSVDGVSEFIASRTDFGGPDSPLGQQRGEYDAAQKRCGSTAWNTPIVFGPIAITYNLTEAPNLVLDGPTAAKIFNGTITRWDDPAIKGLNPTVQLPSEDIQVVYRSGESGTTDSFQRYLDPASTGLWGKGSGKTFNGAVGQGAKGLCRADARAHHRRLGGQDDFCCHRRSRQRPGARHVEVLGTDQPAGLPDRPGDL